MKKIIQLSAIVALVILASCKGQELKKQPKNNEKSIANDLTDNQIKNGIIDTIYIKNAPTRITRKVKQDGAGNLLIAAFDDVIRYDGNSFTHLEKKEGLDSWYAFDVLEDKNGNIWFNPGHTGLYEAGLSRFDEKSLHLNKPSAIDIFKANGTYLGITEDKEGHIWVGGSDGIWRYNGNNVSYFTGNQLNK